MPEAGPRGRTPHSPGPPDDSHVALAHHVGAPAGSWPRWNCSSAATTYSASSPQVNRTESRGSIGRASCRDRVCQSVLISVVAVSLNIKHKQNHMNSMCSNKIHNFYHSHL